jgi:hypothetical protein
VKDLRVALSQRVSFTRVHIASTLLSEWLCLQNTKSFPEHGRPFECLWNDDGYCSWEVTQEAAWSAPKYLIMISVKMHISRVKSLFSCWISL